jgi:transcriptional regulator with XRE-family HTH domain
MDQRIAMGQAIKKARNGKGLTLRAAVARFETFGLAWPHSTLSDVENGKRGLHVRELLVIAASLNTSPDSLAIPDCTEPLDLTDSYAMDPERARSFWQGRSGVPRSYSLSHPKTSWPWIDEVFDSDARVDYATAWRASRPRSECQLAQNAAERPWLHTFIEGLETVREIFLQARPSAYDLDRFSKAVVRLRRASNQAWVSSEMHALSEDVSDEQADNLRRFNALVDRQEATE